jgi:hypothetical protein
MRAFAEAVPTRPDRTHSSFMTAARSPSVRLGRSHVPAGVAGDFYNDVLAALHRVCGQGQVALDHPSSGACQAASRVTRGQRRLFVRIENAWPWRRKLAAAVRTTSCPAQPIN